MSTAPLVLNLHQSPGNLERLLETQEREARAILWAIDRIPGSGECWYREPG